MAATSRDWLEVIDKGLLREADADPAARFDVVLELDVPRAGARLSLDRRHIGKVHVALEAEGEADRAARERIASAAMHLLADVPGAKPVPLWLANAFGASLSRDALRRAAQSGLFRAIRPNRAVG